MPIKAIETEYRGYRFRSRLEARWAVFFDTLGIKWEYETEGFENEHGDRYLPDFYLRDFDIWCEVKPNDPDRIEEIEKACLFVGRTGKMRALVLLPDIPKEQEDCSLFWFQCVRYDDFWNIVFVERIAFDSLSIENEARIIGCIIDSSTAGRRTERILAEYIDDWEAKSDTQMECPRGIQRIANLDKAYKCARQARFGKRKSVLR